MTTAAPGFGIRPIKAEEFDSYHTVFQHAFNNSPPTDEIRQWIISHVEFDRTVAAFDGSTRIGTAGAYTFRMAVPGQRTLPAAWVTWVAVLPSHRRRGVLSAMMRHQLADVAGRGEPLAVRLTTPLAWKKFTLYRRVPASGNISLTVALTGIGRVAFDDLRIEPLVVGSSTPNTPAVSPGAKN